MKSSNFRRSIVAAVLAGCGLLLLLASHGLRAAEQAPRLAPHAPLTLEQRSARAAYWASKRGLQFGVPQHAFELAFEAARALPALPACTAGRAGICWSSIGPQPMLNNFPNFGGLFTGPPMTTSAGRVAAVAADPLTKGLVYVGAAGGGIWRSSDGGATFTPVFEQEPAQAIGAITVDRNGNVWVGTGEGVQSDSYYGQGIFKSSDHGASWAQITGGTGSPFIHSSFRRIAVDDRMPPHIFAAVTYASSASRADASFLESNVNNDGLWRSTDGGTTWIQVGNSTVVSGGRATFNGCSYFGNSDPCPGMDVVVDPNNHDQVYASINFVNVFISSDGGSTWSEATFPGIETGTVNEIGRAALAVTSSGPGKPAIVYASVGGFGGHFYRGFFSSSDSGTTWAQQSTPTVVLENTMGTVTLDGDGTGVGPYGQSAYDQTVTVVPGKPQTVYFGGVGPYVSSNGGGTWNFIAGPATNTKVQVTHSDQQASAIDPFNPNKLYIGNDGGFYVYDLAGGNWTTFFANKQNTTISSGQIQGIGPHPTDNTRLLAGFQDNGTQLYTGALGWNMVETGDGGFALFDGADPNFAYHTFATSGGPQPARSTDGGLSWNSNDPPRKLHKVSVGDAFGFYPPLAADPASGARVLIGGHLIYVSTDGMLSWQIQSNNLTGSCPIKNVFCPLQDIEFVPNTTMAWALSMQSAPVGFVVSNTTQANLNSGVTWTNVTAKLPFSSAQTQATGIGVDPNPGRAGVAYLSISGFTATTGIGHIYQTMDFGKTWKRDDGTGGLAPLPDVPTLRILVDNTDSSGKTLLAGTDIGVFRSSDGGATWAAFNLGVIPAVPIFDLEQNHNGVIFAGTHGRGAYQLSVPAATPTATPMPTATSSKPTPTPSATPTAGPGAMARTIAVAVSAAPGANVGAGSLTITNTTSAAETVSSVSITVSDPAIFSSLTLSGGEQTVTSSPHAVTVFTLAPSGLAAGASLTFSLNAAIAGNAAMLSAPVKYAGLTALLPVALTDKAALPMAIGLMLIGLALTGLPADRRRRIVLSTILLIALAATQLGCGGSSNTPTLLSSSQAVTGVAATFTSGGAVKVEGLPAQLGIIRVL